MNKIFLTLFILAAFNTAFASPAFESKIPEEDALVEATLKNIDIKKPYVHKNYDYNSTKSIPLRISIKNRIKSEKDLFEGQIVDFIVQKSIYEDGRIKIRRGDIIKARVSTIITSGMNGIPASIIFDNFTLQQNPNEIKPGQITNTLEVFGQDRTYFVFPLKWALTLLPPTGSLTNFIKGGHAKLNTNKIYTLYYHPEWL